ncbi:MAG: GlxA family transcriptional regulator [Pseudomonadota bacterium]
MPLRDPVQSKEMIFFLGRNLSMIAFAAAIEPLRIANRLRQEEVYTWRLVSEDGGAIRCSNGCMIRVDSGLDEVARDATIIVCTGVDVHLVATKPVLTWLRRESRRGITIGAVDTGTHVLAKAGLLDGRRCTIHWENQPSFMEEFPDIEVTNFLFEIDNGRFTCAGGASASDMMLQLIADREGQELAGLVADQMIHAPVRTKREEQRLSVPARIGVRHPKLVSIIQMMERNLEEPISPSVLAKEAGMSTRQLERLFRRYLNRSPKRYYMEMRLQRARQLLLQTDMSVINVALACGFTSPSHFSKCYRSLFERTPYRERGTPEAQKLSEPAGSPPVAAGS